MRTGAGEERFCSKCGTPLPADAPQGICPRCELLGALALLPTGTAREPHTGSEPAPAISLPGCRFGNFELLEEIARGGMGIVYRARQVNLDRIVAVKMLLGGLVADKQFVQRFRAEAGAAAVLQHPNIVAVHDVGVEHGQHYFSMELVEGQNLAQMVGQQPLLPARAARYVKLVAQAIEYAHAQGILHRDLKPSNVLVDAGDQPRVTDFGLAKRLDGESSLSMTGQVLGSPNFIPPEQASPDRGKVGRYSDVYGLGGILYFLLTARAPFQAHSLEDVVAQVLAVEPISPRLLNPAVPRDLETICLKCLEKEPGRRYQTAQAVAEDLDSFLRHEPIRARPLGRAARCWRWCRRKPGIATLSATTVLLLLAVAIGSPIAAYRIKRERNVAQGRLYAAQMKLAHAAIKAGKSGGALKLLESQRPTPGQLDFRSFDWRFLYRLCQSSQSEVLSTNASGFSAVDWSPDERTVALGTRDGAVELFDCQTRQRLKHWRAHEGVINDLAFCPKDSNWLVTIGGGDGLLKLWDVARERVVVTTNGSKGFFPFVAFSPSGKLLMTSAPDNLSVNLWEFQREAPDQVPKLTLRTNLQFIGPAAFSPDEQTLAVCLDNDAAVNYVTLCDLNGQKVATLPTEHADAIQSIAFSPDGRWLATGGADERVVLWDLDQRKAILSATDDLINVMSVAFSTNGQALYVGGWDSNLRLWEFTKPNEMLALRGHSAGVDAIAISPGGTVLASAGRDGTARLWNLPANEAVSHALPAEFSTLLRFEDTKGSNPGEVGVFGVAVSPDESKVVAVANAKLWLFDLTAGATLATASVEDVFTRTNSLFGAMGTAAFSPDGRTVAVGSGLGDLAFLDASTLRRIKDPTRPHDYQLSHTAFGLGGTILITGGGFGKGVVLSEFPGGGTLTKIVAMEGGLPVQPLAVSADGKLLATGSPEQRIQVWDLASRRVVASSPLKVRLLLSLAFSPDGQWLAIPDELGTIFLWDYRGQRPLRKLVGHAGAVLSLAFSTDGRTLASGSTDHTIKLWHTEIDQEVATLEGHTGWVWCVAFAEHGKKLVSGSRDGSLRIWRSLSFEEIEAAESRQP